MSIAVRRAGAFVLVGLLAFVAPALVGWGGLTATVPSPPAVGGTLRLVTAAAAAPFLAVAGAALLVDRDSRFFELLARPGDYEEGRLYALAGFALAAAGLTVVAVQFGMPLAAYTATVVLLVVGNLAEKGALEVTSDTFLSTTAFAAAAFGAGVLAQFAAALVLGDAFGPAALTLAVFLAAAGALLAALLRSVLYARDDPLIMLTVGLTLWLFADLGDALALTPTQVVVALAISVALGYVSYALDAASITGMLTGVFLVFLTVMLGDYGWFAVLLSFFGIGALSTKFRYEEKRERGIAQENEGARGSGNVLANSAVALAAVLGYAATARLGLPGDLFLYAFTGSLAAALSDTLSSEIGGLYDRPRLITTFEPVPAGTDGGVTWQGEVAGVAGSVVVAAIAFAAFPAVGPLGAALVVVGGLVGMTVDSLLGATVEGDRLDNMGVNFLATLAAAIAAAGLAVALGVVVPPML